MLKNVPNKFTRNVYIYEHFYHTIREMFVKKYFEKIEGWTSTTHLKYTETKFGKNIGGLRYIE